MKVRKLLLGLVVLVGGLILMRGAHGVTHMEEVDLVFNFEPTLSVSLSGDLLISNLVPGTADYSNTISVTVDTNNATGYTLSARAGDGVNYTDNKLVKDGDSNEFFSTLEARDDALTLSNFSDDIWGFSTATSIVFNTTTFSWLQSNSETTINKTINTTGDAYTGSSFNVPGGNVTPFTIGAKAATDLDSGDYRNVINFTAVANALPKHILLLTYMQDFKGLKTATDVEEVKNSMTTGKAYTLKDSRDNKSYFITKQADGYIWMSQNLDLCIGCSGTATLTSENTNLIQSGSGAYISGYAKDSSTSVITWTPDATANTSTHTISGAGAVAGWSNSTSAPYSAEGGEGYLYTNGGIVGNDAYYSSLEACVGDHSEAECISGHVGNYYNWSAVVASNNSSSLTSQYGTANNSICPAGWRLPKGASNSTATSGASHEFGRLYNAAGVTSSVNGTTYRTGAGTAGGFVVLRQAPLYFVRAGGVDSDATLSGVASMGYYWSSTRDNATLAHSTRFRATSAADSVGDPAIAPALTQNRGLGFPVRCIAKDSN